MTGCEIIKCKYYKNGICTDEAEYVNQHSGEPMCRHNSDAVTRDEYIEKNANLSIGEIYKVLKGIISNCEWCEDGYIEVYPPDSVNAYTGCGDPIYEMYECPFCYKARQIIEKIDNICKKQAIPKARV